MGPVSPALLEVGSLVVTGLACISAWLLRRRNRNGWRLMKYEQYLWAAYGLFTYQFTFIASALWYWHQSREALRTWRPPLSAAELAQELQVIAEKVRAAESGAQAATALREALECSRLDVPMLAQQRAGWPRWWVWCHLRWVGWFV